MKLRYNKYLGGLILVLAYLSVFNKPLAGILRMNGLSILDEVLLVLGILVLVSVILVSKKIRAVYLLVFGFLLYSIVISAALGLNRDWTDIVLQSVINLKFLILILSFLVVFKDRPEVIQRFFNSVLLLAVIGLVLNVILGRAFNEAFNMPVFSRPSVPLRYGGFLNPNHLAFLMAMYIGILLNRAKTAGFAISINQWGLIAGSLLVIGLTDSRTALTGVVVFFVAYYWDYIQKKPKVFLAFFLSLLSLLVLLLSFSNIIETTWINLQGSFSLDSYYIRGIIMNMAVQISYFYFPVGTGAATFGSLLSDGSKVYEDFGVAELSFFVEKRGIYDSSFASILGEYGFIGIVCYAFMFFGLYRILNLDFPNRGMKVMIMALFAAFILYSFTNPTLTNNVYILISIPVFFAFGSAVYERDREMNESRNKINAP